MDHLPDFYSASPEMAALQAALQAAIHTLWTAREELEAQLDPATATWGLSAWEGALRIPSGTASPAVRRAAVLQRLQSRLPATADRIAAMASEVFGGLVSVEENPAEYSAVVRSNEAYGVPEGLDALTAQLKPLFPAHISWTYGIRHNTWAETMAAYPTWGDIEGITWANLKAADLS